MDSTLLCHAVSRDVRELALIKLDTITSHSGATFYNQLLKPPGDLVVVRVPRQLCLPNLQVRPHAFCVRSQLILCLQYLQRHRSSRSRVG